MTSLPSHFRDANYQLVPYDGSPVSWRVSIYGLCIQDDQLLTIKNKEEIYWDVPGGGVEMGEDLSLALEREAAEEAGWFLRPVRPLWSSEDWFYHSGDKAFYRSLQMFWLAEGHPLQAKPTDPRTEAVRLVPLSELTSLELYPKAVEALVKGGLLETVYFKKKAT